MEAIIRNRIIKDLTITWVLWIGILIVIFGSMYVMEGFDALRDYMPAKSITAGENLSKYEGMKVRCSIRYVGNCVVQYYRESDPWQHIYACGYVALDDHLENPFCVFVPVIRKSEMNQLLDKAWASREAGEIQFGDAVELKGTVQKMPIDDKQYFVNAVNAFYGNSKPLFGDVYYIDDQGCVEGRDRSDVAFIVGIFTILFLGFTGYFILCTVRSLRYPQVINDFIMQGKMSKTRLETAFQYAEEINQGFWISPEITVYYVLGSFGVLLNRDLVWAYVKGVYRGRSWHYYLELFDKNQKQCAHILVGNKHEAILNYYEEHCPHMVTGDDKEKRNMFNFAFDRFLRLRYYWNIGMQYDDQPAGLMPEADNDLCGYQNLSFDEESGKYEDDTF